MTVTNAMRLLDKAKAAYTAHEYDHSDGAIDGEAVAPKSYNIDAALLKSGTVLQVGKRKFARLA